MSSAWRNWGKPLALGFLLACSAAGPAPAQFFFQPLFHGWGYDLPSGPGDAPRYASRRAVARILAGAGYELVGPLRRYGDQIVATGVNRRDGDMRFFIDPYEGEIIDARRLWPPAADSRAWGDERSPAEGSRPPARERGPRDPAGGADAASRRAARVAPQGPAPQGPVERAPNARGEMAAPAPNGAAPMNLPGATATQTKPPEAAKPIEAAKPAEPPKPVDGAKPAEAQTPPPAQTAKPAVDQAPPAPRTDAAAAAAPEAKPLDPAPSRNAPPARSTGSSHRAIVPPKPPEGASSVDNKTPATVAMPKSAQ